MEGGENHEPPRFCFEVDAPRGGRKLAVLRLHYGAAEATVTFIAKRCVLINDLGTCKSFFCVVLSKWDNLFNVLLFTCL